MNHARLWAVIVKEARAVLRDPRARVLLVGPPLIQLLVFAFASTIAISDVRVGIRDLDQGRYSREIIARVGESSMVGGIVPIASDEAAARSIDRQDVLTVLRFEADFSRKVMAGEPVSVDVVYDGRRSNAAQLFDSYLRTIVTTVAFDVRPPYPDGADAGSGLAVRHFYNPNLIQLWFIMPALVAVIAAVSILALVTQSVARERELGTFDQLRVSPLRIHEIMIGKMLPSMTVGFLNVTLFVVLLPLVFGIPLVGSLVYFYCALIFYLLALTGLGMLVSCLAATQQQAFLGMFALGVPMVILSGYAGPIDNMPLPLQALSWFNPAAWFVEIAQGTFLKGMSASMVLASTWPLALFALVTIALSALLLRVRMG